MWPYDASKRRDDERRRRWYEGEGGATSRRAKWCSRPTTARARPGARLLMSARYSTTASNAEEDLKLRLEVSTSYVQLPAC